MATNPAVREAVLRKLGITPQALSLRAQKVKRSLPMTTADAVYVIAHQEGVDIAKHLDVETTERVRRHISTLQMIQNGTPSSRSTAPPAIATSTHPARSPRPRRGRKVFVVHGRNESLRRGIFAFLRAIGLQPLEWTHAVKATGKGAPYVGEVLDAAFDTAAAIVVVLSPDDLGRLKPEFIRPNDPEHEKTLTPQARPNVLFEAGMAFGHRPANTVLVQVGEVRPFSDIGGRHVTHLDNSAEKRLELATKLRNAGCNVDTAGTDWLREGDFAA